MYANALAPSSCTFASSAAGRRASQCHHAARRRYQTREQRGATDLRPVKATGPLSVCGRGQSGAAAPNCQASDTAVCARKLSAASGAASNASASCRTTRQSPALLGARLKLGIADRPGGHHDIYFTAAQSLEAARSPPLASICVRLAHRCVGIADGGDERLKLWRALDDNWLRLFILGQARPASAKIMVAAMATSKTAETSARSTAYGNLLQVHLGVDKPRTARVTERDAPHGFMRQPGGHTRREPLASVGSLLAVHWGTILHARRNMSRMSRAEVRARPVRQQRRCSAAPWGVWRYAPT